ncbi:hypothetical protein [Sphingomonas mucosissima]|uniref:Bro-N domain-containing protein n=1 Tax=Sphingomonas mucosissima TaxID=370959 RepID=A0A245ZPW7_9SPHN|nr:hypothetical protein [Sphingomonas mucosissima]OWK31784.1 hypothetical protein SPMU_01020 [Sphingomonas mucosissima]
MTDEQTLHFGKQPVRIVTIDGALWFTAADLYETKNRRTNKQHLACFDRSHLRLHTFQSDAGPRKLTLVSTLGALTIASGLPEPDGRIMDAWVRKQVAALGLDRPPFTLGADGALPARPKTTWLAFEDWEALAAANPHARRNSPVQNINELDDDDTPVPFKPSAERVAADRQAMLDAEYEIVEMPRHKARPRKKKR